jgi:hypothetical protein
VCLLFPLVGVTQTWFSISAEDKSESNCFCANKTPSHQISQNGAPGASSRLRVGCTIGVKRVPLARASKYKSAAGAQPQSSMTTDCDRNLSRQPQLCTFCIIY